MERSQYGFKNVYNINKSWKVCNSLLQKYRDMVVSTDSYLLLQLCRIQNLTITIHSKGHNMIFTTCGIKTNHENFEIICGKYIETWLIRPTISTASIMSDLKFDYNIFHSTIRNNSCRSWETLGKESKQKQ